MTDLRRDCIADVARIRYEQDVFRMKAAAGEKLMLLPEWDELDEGTRHQWLVRSEDYIDAILSVLSERADEWVKSTPMKWSPTDAPSDWEERNLVDLLAVLSR